MYVFFGAVTASPLLVHGSDPSGIRKLRAVPPVPGMLLLAWYEGFDSVSRERRLVLLRMSCAKRGMTGKQVTRMIVANSARLSRIQCVSQSPMIKSYGAL